MKQRTIPADDLKKTEKVHQNFCMLLERLNWIIENKTVWLLLLVFGLSILSKVFFIPSLGAILFPQSDEHIFIELAKSFYYHRNFVSNLFPNIKLFNEMLFPLLLSPLYAFYSPDTIITIFRIFGLIVMSSAVFPAYKLSLAILKNRSQALIISIISILIPEMTLAFSVIQEVIYYPLFLFTMYILYKNIAGRRSNPVLLGFLFFLVWSCKAVGATMFAGYIAYLLCDLIFIDKLRHFKFYAVHILVIVLTVLGFRELLSLAIRYLNYGSFAAVGDFYMSGALSRFKVPLGNFILDLVNGFAHYLFFLALIFMIFPLILPIDNLDQYESKDRKFLLFLVISFLIAITTVVILIYTAEGGAVVEAQRVHYRYLFPFLIPFLVMMYKLDFSRLKLGLFGFLYLSFFILYYVIFRAKFDPGSIIDAKSLLIFSYFQYQLSIEAILTFLLAIIIFVFVGYLLDHKVEGTSLKRVVFWVFSLLLIINQGYAIRYTYWYYNTGKNGIARKNEYSTLSSMVNAEPGTPVYVNLQNGNWDDLLYTTQSSKDLLTARPSQNPLEYFYEPQSDVSFLITSKDTTSFSKIQNIELIKTDLTLFSVYQFTNKPNGIIRFDYLLKNAYPDNLLKNDSVLYLAGVDGKDQIEVALHLKTVPQAKDIWAILKDSTGKTIRIPVSSCGKTVTLLFYKNSDELNFTISFGSEKFFVPAEPGLSDDTRKLTYYISNVEIK